MDKCLWIGSGYPVLLVAIAALWKVYQKSQKALLAEKEEKVRILLTIKGLLKEE